jgi:hypothetical protein
VFPEILKSGSQFNPAFGTVAATADTIIARDENGRAQISAPVQAGEIANKGYVDSRGSLLGEIRLLSFRPEDLATSAPGWYFCNGDNYLLSGAVGAALNALPANFKSDWEIVASSDNINVPDMFYADGRGVFLRAADGTVRLPGSFENDALQSHWHWAIWTPGVELAVGSGSGSPYRSVSSGRPSTINTNNWGTDDPVADRTGINPRTAGETRVLNMGMTPAIFLGV